MKMYLSGCVFFDDYQHKNKARKQFKRGCAHKCLGIHFAILLLNHQYCHDNKQGYGAHKCEN